MRKTLSRLLLTFAVLGPTASLSGCANSNPRVVIVPPIKWVDGVPTDLVKLGPDAVRVYVHTADGWTLSDNKVSLEGWLASPPPPAAATGDNR